MDVYTMNQAELGASLGQVHLIREALERGDGVLTTHVYAWAAWADSIECLEFLWEAHCPFDADVCAQALMGDSVHAMHHCVEHRLPGWEACHEELLGAST